MWLRPRRSLTERLMGRASSPVPGVAALAAPLQRLLAGGIYYLEPSHLLGDGADSGG
jgi:hypothetical protein